MGAIQFANWILYLNREQYDVYKRTIPVWGRPLVFFIWERLEKAAEGFWVSLFFVKNLNTVLLCNINKAQRIPWK